MNIFRLDDDPLQAAVYQCDKHVVKMCLETAQLLSTTHHVLDGDEASTILYKATHKNHPSAVWARENSANYLWLLDHFDGLLSEYEYRYGKHHACNRLMPVLQFLPKNITHDTEETPFRLAMPKEYHNDDPVKAYRDYYWHEKRYMATWPLDREPTWWSEYLRGGVNIRSKEERDYVILAAQ
jgi:hypothetical protein